MSDAPEHRHEMTLRVGANSIDALAHELRMIADRLEHERDSDRWWQVTGGGFHFTIEHDPTMTAERYDRELDEWFAARKAARQAEAAS